MHIAFVHPHKAFLPGIQGYRHYFASKNWKISEWKPGAKEMPSDIDAVWYFMGTHFKRSKLEKDRILVHEYASLSIPPFERVKDLIKKRFSTLPDYRIFTNTHVAKTLHFDDPIPYGCREDVGINPEWLNYPKASPEYDFIYIGSLTDDRQPRKMLQLFEEKSLKDKKALLIGNAPVSLQKAFSHRKNIEFHPPVTQDRIPYFLARSRFALNYIPLIDPFQHLTSTKMLEYCAIRIPVLSTPTPWMLDFQKKSGGNFWMLDEHTPPTWEELLKFPFRFPDMNSFTWEQRIKQSGIENFLERF